MQDSATQWIQSYPCKTQTSHETARNLQKFLDPEENPKAICTDNSLELGQACEDLQWNHCASTLHRSETNGIAKRVVRGVIGGISTILLQSGHSMNSAGQHRRKVFHQMGKLHTSNFSERPGEAQINMARRVITPSHTHTHPSHFLVVRACPVRL